MSQEAQNQEVAAVAVKVKTPKVVKEKVKLVKAVLAQEIQDGKKIQYFIDKYELCEAQMRKALKACGFKIRSFQEPQFVFEDDEVPANQLDLFETSEAILVGEAVVNHAQEAVEVAVEVFDTTIQEVTSVQAQALPEADF